MMKMIDKMKYRIVYRMVGFVSGGRDHMT